MMLKNALQTRDETDKTTPIELKHQKFQCKQIQKELKKNTDLLWIQILQSDLSKIGAHIETLNSFVKDLNKLIETLRKKTKLHKDNIVQLHKDRGCNVDSVLFRLNVSSKVTILKYRRIMVGISME